MKIKLKMLCLLCVSNIGLDWTDYYTDNTNPLVPDKIVRYVDHRLYEDENPIVNLINEMEEIEEATFDCSCHEFEPD